MTDADPQTTRLTRYPERGSDDRTALDALLDSVRLATLSTVSAAGEPWAVPMFVARRGDEVLLHGSTGAGALRHVAAGAPVVLTVAVLESLVLARTAFDHSADYRSASLRGVLRPVPEEGRAAALEALTDALVPGRSAEVPPMTSRELAATSVLSLPIVDGSWILKLRTHGFAEAAGERPDPDPTWAGVVPVSESVGQPVPAPGNAPGVDVPVSVRSLVAR